MIQELVKGLGTMSYSKQKIRRFYLISFWKNNRIMNHLLILSTKINFQLYKITNLFGLIFKISINKKKLTNSENSAL